MAWERLTEEQERTHDATPEEVQRKILEDWGSGRAYLDNNGNYRLKAEGRSKGPVAPWNRQAKMSFPSCDVLHWNAVTHKLYPRLTETQRRELRSLMDEEFGVSYARSRFWEASNWIGKTLREWERAGKLA